MPRPRKIRITTGNDRPLGREFRRRFSLPLQRCLPCEDGISLVVGISGGADSTTLLHLLSQISAERHLRLEAAYLDHEIRSKEERVAELGIVRRIGESLRI